MHNSFQQLMQQRKKMICQALAYFSVTYKNSEVSGQTNSPFLTTYYSFSDHIK